MLARNKNTSQQSSRTCEATVGGQILRLLCSDSFPVTTYTEFILELFPDVRDKRVLDFGTGCGALAIAASLSGAKSVLACDVSAEALTLAGGNAERYNCDNITFTLVDRKNPAAQLMGNSFDVIICNPASLPARFQGDPFWSGGKVGLAMINPLIDITSVYLANNGSLRFVHTSLAPLHLSLSRLANNGFAAGIIRTKHLPFRQHYAPLQKYFSILRSRGHIYYDRGQNGMSFELLYLVEAKRFT